MFNDIVRFFKTHLDYTLKENYNDVDKPIKATAVLNKDWNLNLYTRILEDIRNKKSLVDEVKHVIPIPDMRNGKSYLSLLREPENIPERLLDYHWPIVAMSYVYEMANFAKRLHKITLESIDLGKGIYSQGLVFKSKNKGYIYWLIESKWDVGKLFCECENRVPLSNAIVVVIKPEEGNNKGQAHIEFEEHHINNEHVPIVRIPTSVLFEMKKDLKYELTLRDQKKRPY